MSESDGTWRIAVTVHAKDLSAAECERTSTQVSLQIRGLNTVDNDHDDEDESSEDEDAVLQRGFLVDTESSNEEEMDDGGDGHEE